MTPCTCTTCAGANRLVSGVCYASCPEGYFDNSGTCAACTGCKTCSAAGHTNCATPRQCISGYQLLTDTATGTSTGCCVYGQYFTSGACATCTANCRTCTSNAANACTQANKGYYLNSGTPTVCASADLDYCYNAGTTYTALEYCKYGSLSNYVASWTSACSTSGSLPSGCDFAFADSTGATKCAKCTSGRYLDISAYTCAASCSTGVAITTFNYTILGQQYTGSICGPSLTHTTSFGDLYMYNVNSCENGYYIVKTGSKIYGYNYGGADFELVVCGKCHDECARCFDASRYSCTLCNTGFVLYMSSCLSACPSGFSPDGSNICVASTCPVLTYQYSTGPVQCVKKCPVGFFANNNTWTCDSCHSDCYDCWGPTNTDCRVCATATGAYAFGDGTCKTCATSTYVDDHSSWLCSPYKMFSYVDGLANTKTSADPELAGVDVYDTITSSNQAYSLDTNSYVNVVNKDLKVNFPTITYAETRICFRYLVEFDLTLKTSSTDWHNKYIKLMESSTQISSIPINRWDFEIQDGTFVTSINKDKNRVFINNLNCTKKDLTLSIESTLTTTASWGVRNLRTYWYYCPLDCISCDSSVSCFRCEEGKFYYTSPNECQIPYNLPLNIDDRTIYKVLTFLFRPNSVYLLFNKKMNFTLGDKFPYFFPTFNASSNSRILQSGSGQNYGYQDIEIFFVGNTMVEVKISKLSTDKNVPGYLTWRYPLVDLDRNGYNYTVMPVEFQKNKPSESLIGAYVGILIENKSLFRYLMTAVSLVLIYAMGANWFMIENCQKLYVLLFFSLSYNKDFELFLDLMDFSFFGWFQEIVTLVLGNGQYWQFVKYDEYLSKYDNTREISEEFLNYIPERKMGKYLVRKSFLIHVDNMMLIFVVMVVLWMIIKPLRMCIMKKYYYKEKLVGFFNFMNEFLHFKFFVRFILLTYPPFIFYGLANLSNIEFGKPEGQISAFATLGILAIWGLAWIQYFISAFLMPTPQESKNMSSGWKFNIIIPFKHFMENLKHPESKSALTEDAEDDEGTKKALDAINQHMVIKDTIGTTNVFRRLKDEVKKGGAKVYKAEDPLEMADLKKKKKPAGFKSIEQVKKEELKELEKQKKDREKQKEKDQKKKESEELKEEKGDEEKKKEDGKEDGSGSDGEGKGSKKSNSSSSSEENEKDTKKNSANKTKTNGDESSDDGSKDSEDPLEQEEDVRSIGKLLGRISKKVEKGPGCCACKRLRKNKCLRKFDNIMERSAKFYTLVRVLHISILGALSWYFGDKPKIQVIIFAATQTMLFIWTFLARPYKYIILNISLITVEFLFTVIAWLLFMTAQGLTDQLYQLFMMILLISSLSIYLISMLTFLTFIIIAVIKFFNSFGEKDPL